MFPFQGRQMSEQLVRNSGTLRQHGLCRGLHGPARKRAALSIWRQLITWLTPRVQVAKELDVSRHTLWRALSHEVAR
jgi:hypothetical protein